MTYSKNEVIICKINKANLCFEEKEGRQGNQLTFFLYLKDFKNTWYLTFNPWKIPLIMESMGVKSLIDLVGQNALLRLGDSLFEMPTHIKGPDKEKWISTDLEYNGCRIITPDKELNKEGYDASIKLEGNG